MRVLGLLFLFAVSAFFVSALSLIRLDLAPADPFHTLTQDFPVPAEPLEILNGGELSPETMPKEPALIVFFGTWCRPCLMEHVLLNELAARTELPFIGVAMRDDPEKVRALLKNKGNPYRTVALDPKMKWARRFSAESLPAAYLTDGKGKVVYRFRGLLTADFFKNEILPKAKEVRHEAP